MGGSAFEILFAGVNPGFTLIVDGQYMTPLLITTALSNGVRGAPLSNPGSFINVDFGSSATRQVSLYARSSWGPCTIAVAASDSLQAWDRSGEASMASMSDSYGGAPSPAWGGGGIFWEAAAQLGIPHMDLDAVGGTGYAPNSVFRNPGDAFPSRLPSNIDTQPDLFITAGGINDNNSLALAPYATATAARAGFEAGVHAHYSGLRTALPSSLLVGMGPWAPRQSVPTNLTEQSKADAILSALRTVGGPWVFLDNLNGGWVCSSGAHATGSGPWQTGTGNSGTPTGNSNGDLYLAADGVHPNGAGCDYLGGRIAADLRAALATL